MSIRKGLGADALNLAPSRANRFQPDSHTSHPTIQCGHAQSLGHSFMVQAVLNHRNRLRLNSVFGNLSSLHRSMENRFSTVQISYILRQNSQTSTFWTQIPMNEPKSRPLLRDCIVHPESRNRSVLVRSIDIAASSWQCILSSDYAYVHRR